ncbi:MAG: hypothetical protein ACKO5C_02240, partial [Ferruginibacter sp.]
EVLRAGGELEGERIIGRRTLELMTRNHLPIRGDLSTLAVGAFSEIIFPANLVFLILFSFILIYLQDKLIYR